MGTWRSDRLLVGAVAALVASACALLAQVLLVSVPDGPVLDAITAAPAAWVVGHALLALVVPVSLAVVLAWRPLVVPPLWWVGLVLAVVGGVAALVTVMVDLVVAWLAFADDRVEALSQARWLGTHLGAPLDRWDLALVAGLAVVGVAALGSAASSSSPLLPLAAWVASLAVPGVESLRVVAPAVQVVAAGVLVLVIVRSQGSARVGGDHAGGAGAADTGGVSRAAGVAGAAGVGTVLVARGLVVVAFLAAAPVSVDRAVLAGLVLVVALLAVRRDGALWR